MEDQLLTSSSQLLVVGSALHGELCGRQPSVFSRRVLARYSQACRKSGTGSATDLDALVLGFEPAFGPFDDVSEEDKNLGFVGDSLNSHNNNKVTPLTQ